MPAPYPSSFLLRGGLPDGDHPYYYQDKEPLLKVNAREVFWYAQRTSRIGSHSEYFGLEG